LMKSIKTPPPTLLRARFATVLDHLPSVPSVVLPIMSLVDTDQAHLLLKQINKGCENRSCRFIQIEQAVRPDCRTRTINLTDSTGRRPSDDKIRHFVPDKICAGRLKVHSI
jgi:hypothetical protein